MDSLSLTAVVDEQLARARQSNSGRSAQTIYGGHEHFLRQTVMAILAGHEMAEHNSPGEATLQVLQGEVKVSAGNDTWEGAIGDFLIIPPVRHSLEAVDDSVVLLTVRADSRAGIQ
ncbi:MAG TPA: cupin domain-containing protein [Mycobacterium sp.]|nr:cupin domain-containing protein [Mycobacterium sp.]